MVDFDSNSVLPSLYLTSSNPSKYVNEERVLVNWCKHHRKIINAGEMKPERLKLFEKLQELMEKYKRVNQYL